MKFVKLMAVAGVAAAASMASADFTVPQNAVRPILVDGVDVNLSMVALDGTIPGGPETVGVVYDSFAFAGVVQTPTTGPGGQIVEDYASIITTPSVLTEMVFVGGVEVANTVLFFDFFDTDSQFVGGYGVRLPSAGFTSIWTITLSSEVQIPAAGFAVMTADDGTNNAGNVPTNAAWRFKDVAPAIGTTANEVYRMKLTTADLVVPEPASLSALGALGLLAARRRR